MKRIILLTVAAIFALSLNSFSQIKVSSTGKVGINNTSPSYQLDVDGDFRVSSNGYDIIFDYGELRPDNCGWSSLGQSGYEWQELHAYDAYFYYYTVYYSDENTKTDIRDLTTSKNKLKALRPVKYKLKEKKKVKEGEPEQPIQEQMGFIAQEIQKIYPEIVAENKDGMLGVRYTALIPVLVKAFQEQQTEIDDLKARIEKLESDKK